MMLSWASTSYSSRLALLRGVAFFAFLGVLVLVSSCRHQAKAPVFESDVEIDMDSIVSRGSIRVVTDYNSFSYFSYKGQNVGFQFELLSAYAKHLKVNLEVVADNDLTSVLKRLSSGDVDVVASSLVVDSLIFPNISFCEPYSRSRFVLVRRADVTDSLVFAKSDTVAVMDGSLPHMIASALADTSSADLRVWPVPNYDAEQLIDLVAEGEVPMTICLENLARANLWKYENLNVAKVVSSDYDLAWAVRSSSPNLRSDISSWLVSFRKSPSFKRIYRKYVIDPREHHSSAQSVKADTYQDTYEVYIKNLATNPRYDWCLLSSVVYQESHFNPNASSWAGAKGLMQLMPETAARFGVDDLQDPQQSLNAGYAYLLWLDARLVSLVPDASERVKFVLAAYNIGLGHIMDAIRLAQKVGKDPATWQGNVETALLLKSNPAYSSDPVVKHGFCRATETLNYVRNVMDRAKNYRTALRKK